MQLTVQHGPLHSQLVVHLDAEESIVAPAHALAASSPHIRVTTERNRGVSGFVRGLGRAIRTKDTLFCNTYTAERAGTVHLSPPLHGAIAVHRFSAPLVVRQDAFLAATPQVTITPQWGGLRGYAGERRLPWITLSCAPGQEGTVALAAHGDLESVEEDAPLRIGLDHLVAFDASKQVRVTAVRSWAANLFASPEFLCACSGKGAVFYQTRNPHRFCSAIGAQLPPRG